MKYTELTFTELVNKIGSSRYFDLPKMLKEAFTRLANTPSYEPPYKVYTALLSQSGTDAPVATVLENTLGGDIVWTRTDIGKYKGVIEGGFDANKTYYSCSNNVHYIGTGEIGMDIDLNGDIYIK